MREGRDRGKTKDWHLQRCLTACEASPLHREGLRGLNSGPSLHTSVCKLDQVLHHLTPEDFLWGELAIDIDREDTAKNTFEEYTL